MSIKDTIINSSQFNMGVRKRKSLGKSQVCPTEYKEKIWGKEEGGEFIIDGYVFRGKKAFSKAVEGLRELMKKGVNKDVNQVKIKVLDVRKNGAGTDIEIEMVENNARGISLLKLYGPSSKKKESVVMVSKSKESDQKFVILLAEKVIKPLMAEFVAGTIHVDKKEETPLSDNGNISGMLQCPFCEKTSHSSPGLKCHITKMHKPDEKDTHIVREVSIESL